MDLEVNSRGTRDCSLNFDGGNCSTGELVDVQNLDEAERVQIQHINPNVKSFCARHHQKRIETFLLNEKSCVDPLKVHKTVVKTNLSAVSTDVYIQYGSLLGLILGQKLCRKCLNDRLPEWYSTNHPEVLTQTNSWASTPSVELSLSPFINSQCAIGNAREDLTRIATTLQISPIQATDRVKKVIILSSVFLLYHFTNELNFVTFISFETFWHHFTLFLLIAAVFRGSF